MAAKLAPPSANRQFMSRLYEAQFGAPGPINQSRPLVDNLMQTALSLFSLNTPARVVLGNIVDSTAIANVYKVFLEDLDMPDLAIAMTQGAADLTGGKSLTTYPPGQMVVCYRHKDLPYAVIMGSLPQANLEARTSLASIIAGASRQRVDEAHKLPLRMDTSRIPDMLSGRPFDATTVGEQGWITETGLRVFLDSFMTMIGQDEANSITSFLYDHLMRIAAYNLELFTAGAVRNGKNDRGEYSDWEGFTPYPWEQFGVMDPLTEPIQVNSAEYWQNIEPSYSKVEPVNDRLMPFHRERVFRGYLGNLFKHIIQAPRLDLDTALYQSSGAVYPGLFDATVTAGGRYMLRAAKGISFTKCAAIISPVQTNKPEQPLPESDSENEDAPAYSPAGLANADAPQHRISGDILTEANNKELQRASGLLDLHAYCFNYSGLHAFFYHAHDYEVPEESALEYLDGITCEIADFSQLATGAYLSSVNAKKRITIDHRYGEEDIYANRCGLDLLEDGGVILYDAFGSQILMTGGSVSISAPGDVFIRAGRNTNLFAGWDAITRAKHGIELSATEAGISLKAETDLQLLGGSGGKGGVLIESKSSDSVHVTDEDNLTLRPYGTGITLRSAQSDITVSGSRFYVDTAGGGDTAGGEICFNAGSDNNVVFKAATVSSFVTTEFGIYYTTIPDTEETSLPPEPEVTAATLFTEAQTYLCSALSIDGRVIVNGGITAKGSVNLAEGHIYTEQGGQITQVLELADLSLTQTRDDVEAVRTAVTVTIPDAAKEFYAEVFTESILAIDGPGHSNVILATSFSFGTLDDYRTEDFVIPEDLWQQQARLSGQILNPWIEKPVVYRGLNTYPYPGRKYYETDNGLLKQDLALFDADEGRAVDRGSPTNLTEGYASPSYAEPEEHSLQTYIVIRGI